VDGYTAGRLFLEAYSQQFKVAVDDFTRWSRAVVKRQVSDNDAGLCEPARAVSRLTDTHDIAHIVSLQFLETILVTILVDTQ